jgi:hypothetical protein
LVPVRGAYSAQPEKLREQYGVENFLGLDENPRADAN